MGAEPEPVNFFWAGTLVVAVFLFVWMWPAVAQTEAEASAVLEVPPVVVEPTEPQPEPPQDEVTPPADSAPAQPAPETPSVEVVADETVTREQLEAKQARILPDSRWYGLKRFGRTVRKAFTFSPEKKIELEVKHANQELVDARQLAEERAYDGVAITKVTEAVGQLQKALATVKGRVADVAENEEEAHRVVANILDQQIKQQKILAGLEKRILENAPEALAAQVAETFEASREQIATHVAEAVAAAEQNPDQLAQTLTEVLERQEGSDFKHIRNLEVLQRLEDHVPPEARGAIRRAEENALKRLAENFSDLPEENRGERLRQYVAHVGGDETHHLEVFDRVKNLSDVPPELAQRMELAKDVTAKRFQERLDSFDQEFDDEAIRDGFRSRAFARFEQVKAGDIGKLRVLDDIRQRVEFDNEKIKEQFEKKRGEAVDQFRATFPDDESQAQAEQFRALSKQVSENPDPATFRLLKELEEKVKSDPKKRAFLEQLENETRAKFVQEAQERGDKFFEQIASSNPQDIEVFQRLKEEFQKFGPPPFGPDGFLPPGIGPDGSGPPPFLRPGFSPGATSSHGFTPPPGFDKIFDRVIEKHTELLGEHVQTIDDPKLFEHFQKRFFQGPSGVAKEIEQYDDSFRDVFEAKRRMIEEQAFSLPGAQTRRQIEEERRQSEEEFHARREAAQSDEERMRLEEERRGRDQGFAQRGLEAKREMFQKRLELDPFCDAACREEESRRFEGIFKDEENRLKEAFERGPGNGPDFRPSPEGAQSQDQGFRPPQQGRMPPDFRGLGGTVSGTPGPRPERDNKPAPPPGSQENNRPTGERGFPQREFQQLPPEVQARMKAEFEAERGGERQGSPPTGPRPLSPSSDRRGPPQPLPVDGSQSGRRDSFGPNQGPQPGFQGQPGEVRRPSGDFSGPPRGEIRPVSPQTGPRPSSPEGEAAFQERAREEWQRRTEEFRNAPSGQPGQPPGFIGPPRGEPGPRPGGEGDGAGAQR